MKGLCSNKIHSDPICDIYYEALNGKVTADIKYFELQFFYDDVIIDLDI